MIDPIVDFFFERISLRPETYFVAAGLSLVVMVLCWLIPTYRDADQGERSIFGPIGDLVNFKIARFPTTVITYTLVFLCIAATLTFVEGPNGNLRPELETLRHNNLIVNPKRTAAIPDATGEFWFYSFYSDPSESNDLILCKERVRIVRSESRHFDYEYETVPSVSECGKPYSAWKGYLVWVESQRGFTDMTHDTASTDNLLGFLKPPFVGPLSQMDSVGYVIGVADYGSEPVSTPYMMSSKDYSAQEALDRMSFGVRSRLAIAAAPGAVAADTVSCEVTDRRYGDVPMREIGRCGGLPIVAPYSAVTSLNSRRQGRPRGS